MKKILLLSSVILLSSVMAQAACNGIPIKSGKYCMSKHVMNWYSAYAWCHAQGMQMVDVKSDCVSLSSCPALKLTQEEQNVVTSNGGTISNDVGQGWTSTSSSEMRSYTVYLPSGQLAGWHPRTNSNYALCKQYSVFTYSPFGFKKISLLY